MRPTGKIWFDRMFLYCVRTSLFFTCQHGNTCEDKFQKYIFMKDLPIQLFFITSLLHAVISPCQCFSTSLNSDRSYFMTVDHHKYSWLGDAQQNSEEIKIVAGRTYVLYNIHYRLYLVCGKYILLWTTCRLYDLATGCGMGWLACKKYATYLMHPGCSVSIDIDSSRHFN